MERVLITGIGGAAGICVAKALRDRYHLVGVDANPNATGQVLVDEFQVVPLASSPEFLHKLVEVSEGCDALFCTVDEELYTVSKNRGRFACRVLVSDHIAIENSLDKLRCAELLGRAGVAVPKTVEVGQKSFSELSDELGLPFFIKPRRGRGARDVVVTKSREDFERWRATFKQGDYIAQEYLGGDEYTVDVLLRDKRALVTVPRRRLLVDSGVSIVGMTVRDDGISDMAARAAEALGLNYIVNVQIKVGRDGPRVTEVNPRPSGGLVLTVRAGVNMPELALRIARGEPISEDELRYESGLLMLRYHEEVFKKVCGV
jgi:carbamoyl-phosphate synthase large subunit